MAILVVAVVFVLALLAQHRPAAFTLQTCGGAGVRATTSAPSAAR
jgi:hypothetical protein